MAGGAPISIPRIGEEFLPHGLYVARARFGYGDTANSLGGASDGLDVWSDTQETAAIFDINSSEVFVHQITWDVETAFTASVTLTLGDGQSAAGFAAAAQIGATVISTGAPFDDTTAASAYALGRRYGSTDSIDIVAGGADIAVGRINVYCIYSYAPGFSQNDTGGSSNT
jgi:hypothetical protein